MKFYFINRIPTFMHRHFPPGTTHFTSSPVDPYLLSVSTSANACIFRRDIGDDVGFLGNIPRRPCSRCFQGNGPGSRRRLLPVAVGRTPPYLCTDILMPSHLPFIHFYLRHYFPGAGSFSTYSYFCWPLSICRIHTLFMALGLIVAIFFKAPRHGLIAITIGISVMLWE